MFWEQVVLEVLFRNDVWTMWNREHVTVLVNWMLVYRELVMRTFSWVCIPRTYMNGPMDFLGCVQVFCLWEANRTIPYHAAPLYTVPGWFTLWAVKCFYWKCTYEVPIRYTLHPTRYVTHCLPMVHGVGLSSGAQRGTVRITLACSAPHGEVVLRGILPDLFGMGIVHLYRCIQEPLWHGTTRARHPWMFVNFFFSFFYWRCWCFSFQFGHLSILKLTMQCFKLFWVAVLHF